MQADEIVQRLEAAGAKVTILKYNQSTQPRHRVTAEMDAEQWQALLPTDEERWAIKAIKAGYSWWPHIGSRADGYYASTHAAHSRYFDGDAPIAALAACGRVLEEGEKRG